jgi:AcrR family transcriptional regulator
VTSAPFQRARSAEAKRSREQDILDAARARAERDGVRSVSLTVVAADIGMHKSALLRYFETREQILLLLAAEEWRGWSSIVRERLAGLPAQVGADRVAAVVASSLVERPLVCDLLAHVPLGLERNVSLDSVRRYKLGTRQEVEAIAAALRRAAPGLDGVAAVDLIAAATSLAGAFWQMANPTPAVGELYRTDPELTHAVVDVEPRLRRIVAAMLGGVDSERA